MELLTGEDVNKPTERENKGIKRKRDET